MKKQKMGKDKRYYNGIINSFEQKILVPVMQKINRFLFDLNNKLKKK